MTEQAKNVTWHRKLRHQLKREQHAAERKALAELRTRIVGLHADRRQAVSRAKTLCRTERQRIRAAYAAERAKIRHAREVLRRRSHELKRRVHQARERCGRLCKLRTERGKTLHAEALAELKRSRTEHAALLWTLRELDKRTVRKVTHAERRSESDDAVRANLPAELVPIFERIKGTIRPKAGRSRTEAVLEWVEAHPDDVWVMHQARADRELRKLLAEEQRRTVRLRKTERHLRALEAVPF